MTANLRNLADRAIDAKVVRSSEFAVHGVFVISWAICDQTSTGIHFREKALTRPTRLI